MSLLLRLSFADLVAAGNRGKVVPAYGIDGSIRVGRFARTVADLYAGHGSPLPPQEDG